jgi:hypothetical protein
LAVESEIDSVKIEKLEILHPTYVLPSGNPNKGSLVLHIGMTDSLLVTFRIIGEKSFKLKGSVYGSHNDGRSRISKVCYLYFYFDGQIYLITQDILDLLGMKKASGDSITKDDLRVFNRVEIAK